MDRSLTGYGPWVCKVSDTTEQLPSHFNHISVRTKASKSVKPYHSFDNRTSLLVSNSLPWLKKHTYTHTTLRAFQTIFFYQPFSKQAHRIEQQRQGFSRLR